MSNRELRFRALATDYDGTIARDGVLDDQIINALERFRSSGRQVVLVTGRRVAPLKRVCPRLDLFDIVVAENGAVLFDPKTEHEELLAEPPPRALVDMLRDRGVDPVVTGRVIVATLTDYDLAVQETLAALALPWSMILNKGSIMLLPDGVDKASGLAAALTQLHLPANAVVGVGDAENDQVFLERCGCSVAVANALPTLQQHVHWVTDRDHGAGVEELIDRLITVDDCRP